MCAIAQYVFTEDSTDGRIKTIAWLQARRLLANNVMCHQCNINMNMVQRERQNTTQDDKWAWRCPKCSSIRSKRCGSWFEGELLCRLFYGNFIRATSNKFPVSLPDLNHFCMRAGGPFSLLHYKIGSFYCLVQLHKSY